MKTNIPKLLILLFAFALSSCVPNKKVAYLQYKNEYDKPETVVKDTLIRKYRTGEFAYKLQANDLLDIKISTLTPLIYNPFVDADKNLVPGLQYSPASDPDKVVQSSGYYVEPDGFVNLPIVGRIKMEGFSIAQAEDSLETQVKKYLDKPVVRIKILNFRFSVLGEAGRQATITSGDNSLTILQAIALAGGPSEFGDISRVKVLRHYRNETYVFYVNLLNEEYLTSPFYYIQPNDVLVLMPLKQRSYLKYLGPNLSLITATTSLVISILTMLKFF